MTVQKGADLFNNVRTDDLGAANAAGQTTDQPPALQDHGVTAGRDLYNDQKGTNR